MKTTKEIIFLFSTCNCDGETAPYCYKKENENKKWFSEEEIRKAIQLSLEQSGGLHPDLESVEPEEYLAGYLLKELFGE